MKIANRVYALIVTLAGAALAVGCSSFTYAQPDAADVVDAADVGEVSDAVDAADIGQGDAMTCAITGQVFCSGSGCTNPQTDQNNCGSCGLQCSRTNGTPSCVVGACAISCTRGYGDCDHEVSTGCEASFDTDSRHCGACGAACPADKVCVASACVCAVGRTLCGTTCVDLATDAANCGGCGLQCVAGSTCNAGWCPLVTQRSCVTAGTPGCGLVPIMYPLTFTMGDSSTDNNGGQPAMSRINLDSFALDAYEVTATRPTSPGLNTRLAS